MNDERDVFRAMDVEQLERFRETFIKAYKIELSHIYETLKYIALINSRINQLEKR